MRKLKIALVHDDLMQWGGLERVLLGLSDTFPEADIFTSVYNKQNPFLKEFFQNKKIQTSFIQKIPGWKTFYKALLPLYPLAFESFDLSSYDLIISITTRFAKAVITKPDQLHICYCFTPPRFLWGFSKQNSFLTSLLSPYRLMDQLFSTRVDHWIAGSEYIQSRIKKVYKKDSLIIPGFVDIPATTDIWDGGFFLIISRLNNYKRVDVAIEAFKKLYKNKQAFNLKVIGIGPEMKRLTSDLTPNIEFLGSVSERMRLKLLQACRAVIITAEEDFGLIPLEAQAIGKPVIAFAKGGAVETVRDRKTGIFFPEQTADSLIQALGDFASVRFDPSDCRAQALNFSFTHFQDQFGSLISQLPRPLLSSS